MRECGPVKAAVLTYLLTWQVVDRAASDARAAAALAWLGAQTEEKICVVGHGTLLQVMLTLAGVVS